MRIVLSTTSNNEVVPFDYQYDLVKLLHKWLGWSKIHDEISLYSFSWLMGGRVKSNGIEFPDGSNWFISFWDNVNLKKIINGILEKPEMFCGIRVKEVGIQETPDFRFEEKFFTASPVLIRKYDEDGAATYLLYDDPESDILMTKTLNTKLKKANLDFEVDVQFDRSYINAKTKLIKIKNINHKASVCPILIKGSPEAIAFAWNVGLGHLTGSGFGALK